MHFTINTIILNKITNLILNLMKHLIFFFFYKLTSFEKNPLLVIGEFLQQ